MAKRFVVSFAPDGSVSVETNNVTGEACLEDMATIEQLVPNYEIADSQLTEDYFKLNTPQYLSSQEAEVLRETNE